MAGWPQHWRKSSDSSGYKRFLSIVRASGAGHHSLIIPKNVQLFPDKTERIESKFYIDIFTVIKAGFALEMITFQIRWYDRCLVDCS